MSKVAFLGLGAMGSRTAANLQSRARADGLEPDSGNQFKKGSLIGAVADQKPPTEVTDRINSQKLEPAASASREA